MRMKMSRGLGLGAAIAQLVLGVGCKKQPYRGVRPDAGAAVVVVERKAAQPRRDGGAALEVPLVDEKEPNDDLARAQPIEFPKGIRGTLAAGASVGGKSDVDVFQWLVGGEGKQAARIDLRMTPTVTGHGTGQSGAEGITLEALDGDGGTLARGEAEAGVVKISNLAVEAGRTFYFRVTERRKKEPGKAEAVAYALTVRTEPLSPGDEEEPNDTAARAGAITFGADESGHFGRTHDEDVFRLPNAIPDGSALKIDLVVPPKVSASIRLRDAAGKVVAMSRGARGQELQLRNAPPMTGGGGTITLRAESGHDLEERWRLRVDAEPRGPGEEVEPNNEMKEATAIELSGDGTGSCAGFLWPGDVDVYRVRVSSPGELVVTVSVPDAVHPKVERLGEDGHVLAAWAPKGKGKGGNALLHTGVASGDVLIRVSAGPEESMFDAPYTIAVALHSVDGGTPAP